MGSFMLSNGCWHRALANDGETPVCDAGNYKEERGCVSAPRAPGA